MRRLFIVLGSIFSISFVLLLAAIAWVLTFDPNANKEWISSKFQQSTGLPLTLGGNIDLTLYPWLGLTLNDVTIGNPPRFSTTPLLQAELAEVRIRLLPLFSDSYEIDTVRLHGARINLEVLGNGETNWAPGAATTAAEDTGSTGSAALPAKLIVGGIDVQDFSLVYDDQFAGTHYEIANLSGGIGALVYGEPLDITLDFAAASRTPQLAATVNLTGTVLYDIDNGRYELDPLALRANLRGPAVPNGSADLSFSAALGIDTGNDSLSLRTFELDVLGTRLTAALEASNMQDDDGSITGTLQLQGDNLRTALTALGQSDLAEVLQGANIDVRLSGTRSDLRIDPLRATLATTLGNTPQTLELDAATEMNLADDSMRVEALTLSGLGLDLRGSFSATELSGNTAFSGTLALPAFNARRLLGQLNIAVPATADASVLQNVGLNTAFSGTANSIELEDLALTLDDSRISGSLAVSDFATLAARFTLAIDSIDADRYLAPADPNAAAASPAPAEPLPVEDLQALDLQGTLNIGALTISQLDMSDILLELRAADGTIALNPFRAALYGGSFDGDIRLDVNGAAPSASVTTNLAAIDLALLLQDFMDSNYLSGTGNIALSLTGSGADSATIKRNLNGSGSLALQEGVLNGIDVQGVLRGIETMLRSRQLATLPQGGQTPFDSFAATLGIANGVVTSNDLVIKAPGWQINGAGTLANLADDTIAFNLVAAVDSSTASAAQAYDLGGYTLPIACTGALASPRCLPDAQQIIASAVGNAVQQRLGDFLQDRLGSGTQQAAPTGDTEPQPQEAAPTETAPEPAPEPAEELLNRALDRLLR